LLSNRFFQQRYNVPKIATVITLLSLLILGVLTPAAKAELATVEQMDQVCRNWLAAMVYEQGNWAGEYSPQISNVQDVYVDGIILARLYSIEPIGYVVVPVLMELPPVKVYADDCNMDVSETQGLMEFIRDVLRNRSTGFIENYGSLEAVQGDKANNEHRALWDVYTLNDEDFTSTLGSKSVMSEGVPLLGSNTWHQDYPYYNYCPPGGACTHTVVGCVATSAAQIMHFWQWPPEGVGYHSYTWAGDGTGYQTLTAYFDDPYDWANMPMNCNSGCNAAQRNALAELNYEVGVAHNMDYGCDGSGAFLIESPWVDHFRYDPAMYWASRNGHTAQSWFDLIRDEVEAGRPMQYTMPTHAIVCDGWREYSGNQMHLNYGWGGYKNGWYVVDNIYYPGGPGNEAMWVNIQPVGDADNDGYLNDEDNCPVYYNPTQADSDSDGVGNPCDICPDDYDPDQGDVDGDGLGDVCDPDADDDGLLNGDDNCWLAINPGQTNSDTDTLGDACDNCPDVDNNEQADANDDGIGDMCDGEVHIAGDEPPFGAISYNYLYQCEGVGGIPPYTWNLLPQAQVPYGCTFTGDTIGEITGIPTWASTFNFKVEMMDASIPPLTDTGIYSITITEPDSICWDADADGYGDPGHVDNDCPEDNCPDHYNPDQTDSDLDGMGDACDLCQLDSLNDPDDDNACQDVDNCPDMSNPEQLDDDLDGIGNLCDNCPNDSNIAQTDTDFDGIGDECDPCPIDSLNDHDEDGYCESVDNCPDIYNPDQADTNGNEIGDLCEGTYICGDANVDGTVNVSDGVWIINYVFISGDPPNPIESGDTNCDGECNVSDAVWIINYVFVGGNDPCDSDGDEVPDC
jgi:Peptidase C10 family/Dockerin type I domain/Thrombospondin type 3 repeat